MQATTAITWFEIPAKDLERAVWFYESVLQQDLRRRNDGTGGHGRFSLSGARHRRRLTHAPNLYARCGRQRHLPAHAAGWTRLCSA